MANVTNSLDLLFPPFREQAEKFAEKAKELDFYIYETYRSFDKQMEYYKSGRELQNGLWVVVEKTLVKTNAKPGMSFHAYGLAFDAVVDADEKKAGIQYSWDDTYLDKDGKVQKTDWKAMGKLSVSLGLEWAGNWKTFTEYPHSQNRFGLQVSELYQELTSSGLESVWKTIYKKIKPAENKVVVPAIVTQEPIPVAIPVVAKEDLDHVTVTTQKETGVFGLILQIVKMIFSLLSKKK